VWSRHSTDSWEVILWARATLSGLAALTIRVLCGDT